MTHIRGAPHEMCFGVEIQIIYLIRLGAHPNTQASANFQSPNPPQPFLFVH